MLSRREGLGAAIGLGLTGLHAEGARAEAARLLNLLAEWVPDGATRKKILVDNPARLYGF